MSFQEPLSVFFDTSGFAEPVTWNGVTVNAIYDAGYFDALGNRVEGYAPTLTLPRESVPGVAHGDVIVRKGMTFKVVGPIEPDMSDVVLLLHLEAQ